MKNFAIILSKLRTFENADNALEQYSTDSEIANEILHYAYMRKDLKGPIMDLGCGTGILGLGCLLYGAEKVYFVDKDQKALAILRDNLRFVEEVSGRKFNDKAIIVHADMANLSKKDYPDITMIIQNPPFGKWNKKMDIHFIKKALSLSDIVYTFHIFETKRFIEDLIKDNGFASTNAWKFRFPIKRSMAHHTKKIEYISVGCWRAEKIQQ
jgi:putative methylase